MRQNFTFMTLSLIWIITISSTIAQDNCSSTISDGQFEFTQETGQLIYVVDRDTLNYTVSNPPITTLEYYDEISLSPNGTWLIWFSSDSINRQTQLNILNTQNDNISQIPLRANDGVIPWNVDWLSEDEFLLWYVPRVAPGFPIYPFSLIDVANQDLRYVYHQNSSHIRSLMDETDEVDSLFENIRVGNRFELSPDGHYARHISQFEIYDLWEREILALDSVPRTTDASWLSDSNHLLYFSSQEVSEENITRELMLYSIIDDISIPLFSVNQLPNENFHILDSESLSDNNFILFERSLPQEQRTLQIINLESNRFEDSCFTRSRNSLPFDTNWSLNGRYLALLGTPQNEDNHGIYIYDTETQITYSVYSGSADIVGWSSISNNEER